MNPQSNEQAGLNLPPPVEQAGAFEPSQQPEIGQIATPELPTQQGAAQPSLLPLVPLPGPTQSSTGKTTNDVTIATTNDVPVTADDGDLIEKEWVLKAKQIVEKTRDDPYRQSKELTSFKADYLSKRYNKNIKLSE